MAEKIFEVKSHDLQEFMSKVPHAFVVWGNLTVFLFLVVLALFLNRFQVRDIKKIPVTIAKSPMAKKADGSLEVLLNTYEVSGIEKNQPVILYIKEGRDSNFITVNGEISRISFGLHNQPRISVKVDKSIKQIDAGMIGNLEILVEQRSFIHDLFSSAFK